MSINLKSIYLLVLAISIMALSLAYIVEYIMGILPCPLCIYERFPYLLFIMTAIIGLSNSYSNNLSGYLVAISLSAILLSVYHIGVQQGYFELSYLCRPLVTIGDNLSVSEFVKLLYNKKEIPTCDRPGMIIFRVSMAMWNLYLNITFFIIFLSSRKLKS